MSPKLHKIIKGVSTRERACHSVSHPAYIDGEMPAVTKNRTPLWLFHWSKTSQNNCEPFT
jgi:hypothetical protein